MTYSLDLTTNSETTNHKFSQILQDITMFFTKTKRITLQTLQIPYYLKNFFHSDGTLGRTEI